MATTIQVSQELHKELIERKLYANESYEEVIWDMIEDISALSEETKKEIARSEKEVKSGRTVPLEEVKKKLGM
jgi:predicted transcriptional regulator